MTNTINLDDATWAAVECLLWSSTLHGTGFWDRGSGEIGDRLTKWAKTFGSIESLYIDTQNCIAWE